MSSNKDIKDAHDRVQKAKRGDDRDGPVLLEAIQVRVAVIIAVLGLVFRFDILGGDPHVLDSAGLAGYAHRVRHYNERDRGQEHEEHDHLENVKRQAVLDPLALKQLLAELVGQTIVPAVFD